MWKTSLVAVLLGVSMLANAQTGVQSGASSGASQGANPGAKPGELPAAPSGTKPGALPGTDAGAQAAAQPGTQAEPDQQVVQWQLQVLRDGQQIDSFDGTTTVGQARTDTHHQTVQHNVGCKDQPAGSLDLSRTLTISPLRADANEVTLSLDTQETLEDSTAQRTDIGCKLPPQPRQVNASHPGLTVAAGQWASWTIVDHDPNLVYRVRANLANEANAASSADGGTNHAN